MCMSTTHTHHETDPRCTRTQHPSWGWRWTWLWKASGTTWTLQTLGSCLSIVAPPAPGSARHTCSLGALELFTRPTPALTVNDSPCDMTQGSLSWPRAHAPPTSSSVHRQQPSSWEVLSLTHSERGHFLSVHAFLFISSAPTPPQGSEEEFSWCSWVQALLMAGWVSLLIGIIDVFYLCSVYLLQADS